MEPAQKTALIRGLIIGFFSAGLVFFGTWQSGVQMTGVNDGNALALAGIAAGTTFFSILVSRVGGEGTLDAARDARDQTVANRRMPPR